MSTLSAIKGFEDMFSPASDVFTRIEDTARKMFFRYGYTELRTPLLEVTELFCRGIGTDTDVVGKEMYTFPDRKGRSLTMRPEATAGVMRACIEHKRCSPDVVNKVFTTGPMFRYERPQKGRLRQFHQINCECLGAEEPYADAELVIMAMRFLEALDIQDLELNINSLGCPTCRKHYRETLTAWLRQLDPEALCEDCLRRLESNPLRVLDCKVARCKEHTADAPSILEYNCADCRTHFDTVLSLLNQTDIAYTINPRLVRGLDYYVRTTFEIISQNIGAQGTVAGGGRYDGLVSQLGGPNIPGLGFACGMERLALLMGEQARKQPDFYLAVLDNTARDNGFALLQTLRDAGLHGEMGFASRSMKSAMRQADKSNAKYALIIGQDEAAAGTVSVKNMATGAQTAVLMNETFTALTD